MHWINYTVRYFIAKPLAQDSGRTSSSPILAAPFCQGFSWLSRFSITSNVNASRRSFTLLDRRDTLQGASDQTAFGSSRRSSTFHSHRSWRESNGKEPDYQSLVGRGGHSIYRGIVTRMHYHPVSIGASNHFDPKCSLECWHG